MGNFCAPLGGASHAITIWSKIRGVFTFAALDSCYTCLMANRIYLESACVYVERTEPVTVPYCEDCGFDHNGACWTPDPFEMDRPDLDFFDYEPSPYSGDYSEM